MKKRVFGQKLSRGLKARRALKRSLLRAFVISGKLTSTKVKLKFVQRDIEKMIGLARKGTLSDVRRISSFTGNDKEVVGLLIDIVKGNFKSRKNGFTRIINLPNRRGDNAQMARMEWVENITENKIDKKAGDKLDGKEEKVVKQKKKNKLKQTKK